MLKKIKNSGENPSELIKQESVLDTFQFQDSMINSAGRDEIFRNLTLNRKMWVSNYPSWENHCRDAWAYANPSIQRPLQTFKKTPVKSTPSIYPCLDYSKT